MASSIKFDGKLTELDLILVTTSQHALVKVDNPSSSWVDPVRPPDHRNVLDIIREQVPFPL